MLELYLLAGFYYSVYVWFKSPKEGTKINNLSDFGNVAVTAVGCAMLWPLVAYVNHLWEPKS